MYKNKIIFILLGLSLALYSKLAYSHNEILLLDSIETNIPVAKYIHTLEDKSNSYTIDSFLLAEKQMFNKHGVQEFSYSYSKSSHWFKFSLKNISSNRLLYILQIANADINHVDFYLVNNNKLLKKINTGEVYDFSTRELQHRHFLFNLQIDPEKKYDVYIRTASDGESLVVPIKLQNYQTFWYDDRADEILDMIGLGFIIFIVILSLGLALIFKKWMYLKYSIYVTLSLFSIWSIQGYTAFFFFRSQPWLSDHSGTAASILGCIFLFLFIRDFLQIDALKHKKISLTIDSIVFVGLTLVVISLLPSPFESIGYIGNEVLTTLTFLLVPGIAIYLRKENRSAARFVLISYIPLTLTVLSYMLRSLGLIHNTFLLNGIDISFTFQIFVLVIALLDNFRRSQRDRIHKIEAQNEELQKLKLASSETDNSIAIFDKDGNIEWCNQGFENLYQIEFDELQEDYGKNIVELSINKDIKEHFKECTETAAPVIYETEHIDNSGNKLWIQTTLSPITYENGDIHNYITIDSDFTQYKKAEEEKKQLQEQLVQSQKMETIGKLAGGIAHDFNNILTPIIGYTDMAISELPQKSGIKEDLNIVLTAAFRAKKLVNQILTFSRQFKQDIDVFLIQDAISEVIKLLKSTIPPNIQIEYNNNIPGAIIEADITQIQQVFMNLCSNAIHAIGNKEGQIIITQKLIHIDGNNSDIKTKLSYGKYIHISVTDNGSGIDKKTIDKVFDPFFTTKEVGKGTGLGLSVVHGIITNYNGDIVFESTPGKGTTINIYLPFAKHTSVLKKQQNDSPAIKDGNNEHILIVDDEQNIVHMLKRLLERHGYKTTCLTSSVEAMKFFFENSESIDLIITDQTMPFINGDEFALNILEKTPKAKIILITGYSEIINSEKADSIGIKKMLFKPIQSELLLSEIRNVLDE